MAYSLAAEIEADFKDIAFTASTLVTATDVTQFIVESDALINAYVGQRYLTPVTAGADALSLLKLYSRTLVADRIKKILEVKQERTNKDGSQDARGAFSTKDVMKGLEQIKKGELALAGATPLISGGGFYSGAAAAGLEPEFKKEEKNW